MNKMQVLAGYCHDISTPLANALGFLKLIEENQWQDQERCQRYLALSQHNLRQIKTLLSELSELAVSDQAAQLDQAADNLLNRSPINLMTFLQQKQAALAPIFLDQDRPLELICADLYETNKNAADAALILSVDISKLERCLDNLLTNALKYGYDHTPVKLAISRAAHLLTIEIINQGPTIAAHDLERLTQPGYRIPHLRSKADFGLHQGLGLAVVQELMTLQGGWLHVESAADTTCFRLLLPL